MSLCVILFFSGTMQMFCLANSCRKTPEPPKVNVYFLRRKRFGGTKNSSLAMRQPALKKTIIPAENIKRNSI